MSCEGISERSMAPLYQHIQSSHLTRLGPDTRRKGEANLSTSPYYNAKNSYFRPVLDFLPSSPPSGNFRGLGFRFCAAGRPNLCAFWSSMVQLPYSRTMRQDDLEWMPSSSPSAAAASQRKPALKTEPDELSGEQVTPFWKRSRCDSPDQSIWMKADSCGAEQGSWWNNLVNEESPLGLRLRKSPSLVDLIQMKLAQASASGNRGSSRKGEKSGSNLGASEKLKASNFPASLLRIGNWECVSRYEGDLVAKCYYAKRKLVWEVLDGGLKSKIEMQWSDISGLKVTYSDNGPGSLEIVLSRQPLFYRETNPQPKKHTLWQATSDFTGSQASIYRTHFLQCPQGLMNKHIKKLLRCDARLCALTQQPALPLENPFFQPSSVSSDQHIPKCEIFNRKMDSPWLPTQGSQDSGQHTILSRSTVSEERVYSYGMQEAMRSPSPCSVGGTFIEGNVSGEAETDLGLWNPLSVPGLRRSMSKSEMVDHIGSHIYNQIGSDSQLRDGDKLLIDETLDELAAYLLGDSHAPTFTDEKSLMHKVNSLCSLLHRDQSPTNSRQADIAAADGSGSKLDRTSESKCISRKDSYAELLLHLPRIASFPHLL